MKWPFGKAIVKIEKIKRGAGHVRLLTLSCGHTKETMHLPKGKVTTTCEDCRREA